MENEEKQEGVTFGEVMKVIGHRIWYILGAAALFTVIMVLLLMFVINPLLATYSMQFRLVFPQEGDAAYPDGTPFFYQDLVSSEFLNQAKASDGQFSGVDVNKMIKNGDITIEAEIDTDREVVTYTGRYTVTVQASYFRSDEQAEAFIEAIANVPVARMRSDAAEVNYSSDPDVFNSAPFEERILLLAQEKENLLAVYDGWIGVYSETYIVRYNTPDNGPVVRRLKDFRDRVAALFGESVKSDFESELEFGGYYAGDLDAYKAQLQAEYRQNEAEIGRITGILKGGNSGIMLASESSSSGSSSIVQMPDLSQKLAELITRNNRIDHWINASGDVEAPTLTEENVEKFAARLSEEFEKLNEEAKLLTNVISAIYTRGMSARFDKQTVTSTGDISMIVGAIGCFIGGFIIAAAVVYAVDTKKKKGTPSDATPSDETPSDGAPKAEL